MRVISEEMHTLVTLRKKWRQLSRNFGSCAGELLEAIPVYFCLWRCVHMETTERWNGNCSCLRYRDQWQSARVHQNWNTDRTFQVRYQEYTTMYTIQSVWVFRDKKVAHVLQRRVSVSGNLQDRFCIVSLTRAPQDKKRYNKIAKELKHLLHTLKNKGIQNYLQGLTPPEATDYSLQKATRKIKQSQHQTPPIRINRNTWARTNKKPRL